MSEPCPYLLYKFFDIASEIRSHEAAGSPYMASASEKCSHLCHIEFVRIGSQAYLICPVFALIHKYCSQSPSRGPELIYESVHLLFCHSVKMTSFPQRAVSISESTLPRASFWFLVMEKKESSMISPKSMPFAMHLPATSMV